MVGLKVKYYLFSPKMVELTGEGEVYSIKHMTRKLVKQYGKYIFISKQDGKPSKVAKKMLLITYHSKIFQRQRNTKAIRM